MNGKVKCWAKSSVGGVFVRSFTGVDDQKRICNIGTRRDVRHKVEIQNLYCFRTKITCTGTLIEPRSLVYDIPGGASSQVTWTFSYELTDYEIRSFAPANIRSDPPLSGVQTVDTELTVESPALAQGKSSGTLRLWVSV